MPNIEINGADEATVGPIREALKAAEKARSVRLADAEASPPSMELPDVATRAGMLIGFDESGELELVDPESLGGVGGGTPPDWRALAAGTTGMVAGWDMADAIEDAGDDDRCNDLPDFINSNDQAHTEFSGRKAPLKVGDCLDFAGAVHFRGVASFTGLGGTAEWDYWIVAQALGHADRLAAGEGSGLGYQYLMGGAWTSGRPNFALYVKYNKGADFYSEMFNANDLSSTYNDLGPEVIPLRGKMDVFRWRIRDEGGGVLRSMLFLNGEQIGSYASADTSIESGIGFCIGSAGHSSAPSGNRFRVRAVLLADNGISDADALAIDDALVANFGHVDAYE